MRNKFAFVFTAALIVGAIGAIGACGSEPETADPVQQRAISAGVDSESSEADRDRFVFVEVMSSNGYIPRYGTEDELVEMAETSCDFMESGTGDVYDSVEILTDSGFSSYDAGFIANAAALTFCPDHAMKF